jgi:branched-chain amino acid transport system substrate-binding protein
MSRQQPKFAVLASVAAVALALASGVAQAQAARGTPIKIGVLNERSGVLGEVGAQNEVGYTLAAKEINAAGGVLGRPIEIIEADDQSDPTQAVNEIRRLVTREKVDIVYGPIGSQISMAVLPVLNEAKIVNVTVAGTTAFTPQVGPYSFSLLPSAQAQGIQIVDFVVDTLKGKNVAMITDGGGQAKAAAEAMKARLKERGITLAGAEEYASGALDMTPNLLNLRRARPDQLILFAQAGLDFGRVKKNLMEIGWDVPISGNISIATGYKTAVPIAGPDTYKNVYSANYKVLTYCSNEAVGSSNFAKYVERIKAFAPDKFAKLSPVQVSYAYYSIYVLKHAIEGAKSAAGPAVAAWLEANAKSITAVQGQLSASKTSHFLLGPEALVMTDDADKVRADGLTKRHGC